MGPYRATRPGGADEVPASSNQNLRWRHHSPRTEPAYCHWVKRYVRFHNVLHPARNSIIPTPITCRDQWVKAKQIVEGTGFIVFSAESRRRLIRVLTENSASYAGQSNHCSLIGDDMKIGMSNRPECGNIVI